MAKEQSGPVQRVIGSLIGVLIGIGLFFGAFYLLWTNEGRVDLSKITRDSIAINGETVDPAHEGQLVALTARLTANTSLDDSPYLRSGEYLQLERTAEMYAWEEEEETDDDGNVTGYSYSREWTSSPENSASFNNPNGHFNPPMDIQYKLHTVETIQAGRFSFNTQNAFLMHPEPLPLNREMTIDNRDIFDDFIYIGDGTLSDPVVGDIRLSYTAYPANEMGTVFGSQNGSQITTYRHTDDETIIFRAYQMDRETAIQDMRNEYLTNLWLTRLGGMAMMWVGLMLILGPINALLGFIPVLGRLGRMLIAVVTFVVALVLSATTIIISAILHNLIALIIICIILIGSGLAFWHWRNQIAS
ncbi:MAG: TMEM43 family protein [Ardenticatenaceae bacterium]|nr:TMEM43 family protein [Ardenticatenaceae bacterium]